MKKKLIKQAEKTGVYENFGEVEQRLIESQFSCDPFGTKDERENNTLFLEFVNWCMNYTHSKKLKLLVTN